jgi:hypothetical protein
MTFQTSINVLQGFGVPGEIFTDGPHRAESLIINSAGATPNTYGYAATKSNSTNIAVMGGAITNGSTVFAGIMANPKAAALWGTTSGALAPTLVIPDNSQADFVTMGDVIVQVGTSCNIGDLVAYNTTTGALKTYAPGGTVPTGCATVPNAIVYRYPVTNAGGGLTVVRLTN